MEKVDCLLDSSALVKRYHTERGTELIDYLFDSSPQAVRYITNIQVAEIISIFYKLERQKALKSGEDAIILRDTFLADIRDGRLEIYDFTLEHAQNEEVYKAVSDVPRPPHRRILGEKKDRCDGIDTMILMTMLDIHRNTPTSLFFCSDEHAYLVAQKLGLRVYNPELLNVCNVPSCLDRRSARRNSKPTKVICKDKGTQTPLGTLQGIDITPHGLRLKKHVNLPIGKAIDLKIGTHQTVDISGTVLWESDGCCGVRFDQPVQPDRIR